MSVALKTKSPVKLERSFKAIELRRQAPEQAENIIAQFKVLPVTAQILAAREFNSPEQLNTFLDPSLKTGLPHSAKLKNIDAACALIAQVVATRKPIAICCDFDVDGLSGGALLSRFLLDAQIPNKVFVPDRFNDGYGLNEGMIRQIASEGFGLVVTVDYGTTNVAELKLARELSLPSLVVDHHHVTEVPPADVFINPQQPGCGFADKTLSAAGLAWYLITALRKALPQAEQLDPRDYLDLACLGTICDMVPLLGANRVIARKGLERLTVTRRAGLQALKEMAGVKGAVSCSHIGFGLGPRINAAGRMVHGDMVIRLLTTTDSRTASKIAKRLNKLNGERQDTEAVIKDAAIAKVEEGGALPWGIVVWDKEFHTGVIGIVAQRLVETFYRPAAVLGLDNGFYKGSVRGVKGVSVVGLLGQLSQYLEKFGGHEGAGGFSIREENLEKFKLAFAQECELALKSKVPVPIALADTICSLGDLSAELVAELGSFAPCGIGNPAPLILIDQLSVKKIELLKESHMKIQVSDGKFTYSAFLWRHSEHPHVQVGANIRLVARPEISSYKGQNEVILNVQAIEPAQVS